ncbi:MAG: outer membrane lipoprotein-sorting protein [Deltaproteobacteria bacterium]|nr:outer membrane lipoprotein-sorting protein [Deltaproteobacteria bacterium]
MRSAWSVAVMVGMAGPALAAEPDAATLLRRYDEVMGPAFFEMDTSMTAHREDGSTRTYKMRVLKSGTEKLRVTFSEPSSAKGQEMLRNGDNLWLYMPNLKRSVRIASRDSFMGGDFNNADVLRVNYEADYTGKLTTPSTIPNTYQLELKAKGPQVAYDVIKLWMTVEAKPLPVRGEFYASSGKMLRSAQFSEVKDFGQLKRPAKIMMRNELATQRYSEMLLHTMTVKDSMNQQRFVLDDLGK